MRRAVRAIVVKDNALLVMSRNKFGNEFYSLVGGGIDVGEDEIQALHREVAEETGLQIQNPKLVVIEDAGDMYGMQYIYTADYVSGEPALDPDSAEAMIHVGGKNLYTPMWLPLAELPSANLMPTELKDVLVKHCASGWPEQAIELTIQ